MQSPGTIKWALADVEFVLAYFPNHPQALSLATEIARRMGSPKQADRYYEKAIQLYPGSAQTWMLYGIQLHRTGRLEDAIKKYRKALKLDNNLAEAHYNLGLALLKVGRVEEAQQHADKAYAMGYPLPRSERRTQGTRSLKQFTDYRSMMRRFRFPSTLPDAFTHAAT